MILPCRAVWLVYVLSDEKNMEARYIQSSGRVYEDGIDGLVQDSTGVNAVLHSPSIYGRLCCLLLFVYVTA